MPIADKRVFPKPGFYYHYKHDPTGVVNNYAYEVVNVAHHTEDKETVLVIYRPLYKEAFVYKQGKHFDARPLEMFMEKIEKGGRMIPRFRRITNKDVLFELQKIKERMYSAA